MTNVINIFNDDLEEKNTGFHLTSDNLEDTETISTISAIYAEAKPINALKSVFETIRQ